MKSFNTLRFLEGMVAGLITGFFAVATLVGIVQLTFMTVNYILYR